MNSSVADSDDESLAFGLSLTALQVLVYFAFIFSACFYSETLLTNVPMLNLPLSFAFGLIVIGCGTALTIFYVLRANATKPQE